MTTPLVQRFEEWMDAYHRQLGRDPYNELRSLIREAAEALAGREGESVGFAVVSEEMDGLAIASDDNGQMLIFCNQPLAIPHMRNGSENVCRVHITRTTPPRAGGVEVGAIEAAPFYWERGGGAKQDAATGYCNGWNDCVAAQARS